MATIDYTDSQLNFDGFRLRQLILRRAKQLEIADPNDLLDAAATDVINRITNRYQSWIEEHRNNFLAEFQVNDEEIQLIRRLVNGERVDLSDTTNEAVNTIRTLLENEGSWVHPTTGRTVDFTGRVFWSNDNVYAVLR